MCSQISKTNLAFIFFGFDRMMKAMPKKCPAQKAILKKCRAQTAMPKKCRAQKAMPKKFRAH